MIVKTILLLTITFEFLTAVYSRCGFSQTCTDPKDTKTCGLPFAVDTPPFAVSNWSSPIACPDLMTPGAELCCNDGQNTLLNNQFNLISLTFGSLGGDGGCDLCAANLKRYFCYYTCSPNQATYLSVIGYVNYTDPFTKKNKTVLSMNYTNTYETACQIFESCKTTAYVSQMSAMQSGKGLLNMLGQNAPSQGPTLINMQFDTDPSKGVLIPQMDKCSEQVGEFDRWGYKVYQNCSCNSCQGMCTQNWDYTESLPGELDGFELRSVLTIYGFIITFALICQFVVRRKTNTVEEEENETSRRPDYQEISRE